MTDPLHNAPAPVEPRTILRPGGVITHARWPEGAAVRSVHVVRIGGAGMSAVARLALEAGLAVSGSDSQDGQFIGPLRQAGARIGIGFDASLLADDLDLVIVSTAVRADNPEVLAARERGIPVIHRAAALEGLLRGRELVAVAGTHGKTTTTGMAVTALRGAGLDPAWALGAAMPDLGRNAGLSARPGAAAGGLAVVEADESDGSFLAFTPRALVVTNLEPDHLDFHGDAATLTAAFDALTERLVAGGTLVVCADDPGARALGDRAAERGLDVIAYGEHPEADWSLRAERSGARGAEVELATPRGALTAELSVTGHHNVLNALGALAAVAAAAPEVPLASLATGLGSFTGASRRFDVAGTAGGATVVDDYAHHPREVAATIAAARGIVAAQPAGGRVLVGFQPHLFSRTRDFAEEFAAALSAADAAWVLPVYAAREEPDPSVDATTITTRAAGSVVPVAGLEELTEGVVAAVRPGDLLLMLGAGDIVELTPALMAALDAPRSRD
ncbi:UDP-N-acetylmuramate--L-alanine ligase [Brachybacterium saurashtrense]|uniref:UDP-N-acetylmuramate--L-alanine ligase n=1 Tax=Brachybacterium saurashtrense TaxID=556288 RepID=A0A345YL35_9MICO|nr:UDP-N-acetylmuramate--L-alanine ligase [Brachybacterium saurashtrense]AXK44637.1 UDP-N-acetylmuramate--L-alanine ligase [Brachybacterium saurashtrense]RRR23249.1 UDP-N-acetylmuramate--L-alanine ligase [Brachybacterium saurashtrense]